MADQKMLTVTQFADALGVNRRTVHAWAKSGRVRAVKTPGGHWRIDARDLVATRLSTTEFARQVGVCYRTAYRWASSGKLDAVKTDGGYQIAATEVARLAAPKPPAKRLTDANNR